MNGAITKALSLALLAALASVLAAGESMAGERRIALLIGNEDYPADLGRLANTHEDVRVLSGALAAVGFDTQQVFDADHDAMLDALVTFELAIEEAAAGGDEVVAFFYASMHGAAIEIGGETRNVLLPARESIRTPGEAVSKGVRIDHLIDRLSASSASAVFVVTDACRNDLGRSFSRSAVKGFVPESVGPGMLVAFATSAGATTPDDGLFARTLAAEIVKPGRRATMAMLDAVERVGRERSLAGQPYFLPNRVPDWVCFNGCLAPTEQAATKPRTEDWAQGVRTITVERPKAFVGSLVGFEIVVDNLTIANIRNNQTLTIDIPSDAETMIVRSWADSSDILFLDSIPDGGTVVIGFDRSGFIELIAE